MKIRFSKNSGKIPFKDNNKKVGNTRIHEFLTGVKLPLTRKTIVY